MMQFMLHFETETLDINNNSNKKIDNENVTVDFWDMAIPQNPISSNAIAFSDSMARFFSTAQPAEKRYYEIVQTDAYRSQ